jgi:phage shock protein PspC (stress-responsive transcriptional regulator)
MEKKLYRDERRKVIGGVCAGLADYFDIDISIIRALFLLTFIFMGTGFMVYIVLWIVLPKKDYNYFNPGVDYRVPPQDPFNPFGNVPPQPGDPFVNPPKKGVSNAGLVFGVILIFIGGAFLLHEVHLFRFWHMGKLWPVILVVAGLAIMVSGEKKKPWEKDNWQATDTNDKEEIKDDTQHKDDDFKQEDKPTDTPPPTV